MSSHQSIILVPLVKGFAMSGQQNGKMRTGVWTHSCAKELDDCAKLFLMAVDKE